MGSCVSSASKNDITDNHNDISSSDVPKRIQQISTIFWDVENVRLPKAIHKTDDFSLSSIVESMRYRLCESDGFKVDAVTCGVTLSSLQAIEHFHGLRYPSIVDQLAMHADIIVSSRHPKCGADYIIKREIDKFIDSHAHSVAKGETRARIVLLSGDADFVLSMQRAIRLGFETRIVYVRTRESPLLLGLPHSLCSVEWTDFLKNIAGHDRFGFSYKPDDMQSHQPHQHQSYRSQQSESSQSYESTKIPPNLERWDYIDLLDTLAVTPGMWTSDLFDLKSTARR